MSRVLLSKRLIEESLVDLPDAAEAFAQRAVEAKVGALLRATLDQHRADLDLLPGPHLELHELVRAPDG